ncbi:MAG TPA: hypothetical protein VK826_09965, partial [Bacteroidia bacterium]|nr:hypothetical protein [Bacteroidia bacterium]
MARYGKLIRCAIACAASLVLMRADISAQNKTQQPSPAPSAEDCIIGFYVRDSVAMQMPGFKPWYDSVQHVQLRKQELQKKYFLATDRLLTATPDSGATVTPQQQSEYNAAKKETETLNARMHAMTDQMYQLSTKYLDPYYDSIARTAARISKQQNMAFVFEIGENR